MSSPPPLGREKGSLTITNMHVVNNDPANDPNWSAALDNLDHLFLVMKSMCWLEDFTINQMIQRFWII